MFMVSLIITNIDWHSGQLLKSGHVPELTNTNTKWTDSKYNNKKESRAEKQKLSRVKLWVMSYSQLKYKLNF